MHMLAIDVAVGESSMQDNLGHFLVGGLPPRYAKDGIREVAALLRHEGQRLTAALLIRPADSQRVHAVLEHPAADSQQIGGVGLDVVCS